jgi:hypothetical protein
MGKLIDIINTDNETNLLQTINLDVSNKTNIMTPEERDEKIVGILTKICINVLVKNLFDKNGVRVYEEVLHELNQLPVNEEEYTRCNHAHSFLHKTAIEYLQKTIVFNEEHRNK